jgi:hypothetical protein
VSCIHALSPLLLARLPRRQVWNPHPTNSSSDSNSGPFVRVLHEGTPVGAPLARMQLPDFVALLEGLVPADVFEECTGGGA